MLVLGKFLRVAAEGHRRINQWLTRRRLGRARQVAGRRLGAVIACVGVGFVGWQADALADVMDSYALQVDGDRVRFRISVNGLPVGVMDGRKLAGAAFFIDDLLRDGDNEVRVETELEASYGTIQLTLSAPADPGQNMGRWLGHAQCGFAEANGQTPACRARDVFRMTFRRVHAPDFRLWHAEAAPVTAEALAGALGSEQAALSAAAEKHDWTTLFYGRGPRKADLIAAGDGSRVQAEEMAQHMQDAAARSPGVVTSSAPAAVDQLVLTALPGNLVAVSRRDHAPVLRVHVGRQDGQDPDDFGDYSERYLSGVYQQTTVIFGAYSGAWQRVR